MCCCKGQLYTVVVNMQYVRKRAQYHESLLECCSFRAWRSLWYRDSAQSQRPATNCVHRPQKGSWKRQWWRHSGRRWGSCSRRWWSHHKSENIPSLRIAAVKSGKEANWVERLVLPQSFHPTSDEGDCHCHLSAALPMADEASKSCLHQRLFVQNFYFVNESIFI